MLIAGIFNLLVHLFDDFIRALLCPWLTGRKSGNLARDGGKVARRTDRESQVGRVVLAWYLLGDKDTIFIIYIA